MTVFTAVEEAWSTTHNGVILVMVGLIVGVSTLLFASFLHITNRYRNAFLTWWRIKMHFGTFFRRVVN